MVAPLVLDEPDLARRMAVVALGTDPSSDPSGLASLHDDFSRKRLRQDDLVSIP